MRTQPSVVFAPLLAVLFAAAGARVDAALIPYDLDGLTRRAECVVRGEVVETRSAWGDFAGAGRVLLTDVRVRVTACWKDAASRNSRADIARGEDGEVREITVRLLGGQIGDRRQVCAESPTFEKGERVVVFAHTWSGRLWVTGWMQGKYRVLSSRVRSADGTTREIDTHVAGRADLPLQKTVSLPELESYVRRHPATRVLSKKQAVSSSESAAIGDEEGTK